MMQRNRHVRLPLSSLPALAFESDSLDCASPVTAVTSPLQLVLDTNIWLDLLLFDDPRCAPLRQRLKAGSARVLVDAACRDEWRRVLAYPALRLDARRAQQLTDAFDACGIPAEAELRPMPWPRLPRCRDRDDQKFLELACAGHATHLISRDEALLALDGRARRVGLFRICRPEALVDPIS